MSTLQDPVTAETVAARLTPAIPSAIATIAVSGPAAVGIVAKLVRHRHSTGNGLELGRVRYGLWNPADDEAAEQVVVCRTNKQMVEIHCHGGNAVCQMILNDLVTAGCRSIAATDFPMDTDCEIKREATIDLQKATTARVAAILLDQLHGALSEAMASLDERYRNQGAAAVRSEVEELLRWSDVGLHLVEPWRVVLAGPPNAGKSSLMNAIVGSARAIVHSEPGTTRDWIEALTAIDGWPVVLTDTAGLRDSADLIEGEGIRRARERVEAADLVLFVVDATVGWTETHESLKAAANTKRTLVVWNKVDLRKGMLSPPECPPNAITTCAKEALGISELLAALAKTLVPCVPSPSAAVPFRLRHVQQLKLLIAG
jgi:tRNA modification GTPase